MSKKAHHFTDTEMFNFKLTPLEAQELYDLLACYVEDYAPFKEIWTSAKKRRKARAAFRRFGGQLNQEYRRTGI
jgi:hypothetical protein